MSECPEPTNLQPNDTNPLAQISSITYTIVNHMSPWYVQLKKLAVISRPRFWIYTIGPLLLGIAAAYDPVLTGQALSQYWLVLLIFVLYFTLPANLLLYGVNDIFDSETDAINPKKDHYESRVEPVDHRWLWIRIAALNLPFLFAALFLNNPALLALIGFAGLGIFYSADPVRAKTKPFLDSLFNILYAMPGFMAYSLLTNVLPAWWAILGCGAWCAAMHAFSAIPDIDADRDSGTPTIATTLDFRGTLIFCAVCYTLAGLCSFAFLSWFCIIPILVYLAIVGKAYQLGKYSIMHIYTSFPLINAVIGALLFVFVVANAIWGII
jgi:lycopene elongase/hydratase (dihydrobisanhydrobacterioruberin-forming)